MTRNVRAYLDWNATAPLSAAAQAAMRAVWEEGALNPSARHRAGQRARAIIEEARETMATHLGCRPEEIIFTSGGTESANLAVKGAPVARYLVSFMEHPAVMRPAKASGRPVSLIEVDENGIVDLDALSRHLKADAADDAPALVCLMRASNETGVIEPVHQAVDIAREHGALIFCDAVQAVGKIPVDFADLGVDMLALSAHKFGGPQGTGALIVREGVELEPLLHGGGQERRRRSGTENVAAIAGMAAALAEACENMAEKAKRLSSLRDALEAGIRALLPDAVIFSEEAARVPGTCYFAHPAWDAQTALMHFDLDGIAVSAGSACHAGKGEVSRALIAMGVPRDLAKRAIRVSMGPGTGKEDIALFLHSLEKLARRLKRSAA